MPELCRFYGVIVRMYFDDHAPAHFQASYGEQEAVIAIDNLSVMCGRLPARAHGLVVEWASLHRDELMEAWSRAKNLKAPGKIAPLE